MTNPPAKVAERYGRVSRRTAPWLTRDDADLLEQLLDLSPDAFRSMSNLLHQQARSDLRHLRWKQHTVHHLNHPSAATGRHHHPHGVGGGRAATRQPCAD